MRGRLNRRGYTWVVAAVVVLAGIGGLAQWVASTRTSDPISGSRIGFEGAGVSQLSVGEHQVFMGFLAGRNPHSQATITGYTLPHIPGVHLALFAIPKPPHPAAIGPPGVFGYASNSPSPYPLAPLVGRKLVKAPAWMHVTDPVLMVALVVTPLRPGCTNISGVSIRYRAADTTFTRSMHGTDTVSTTRNTYCD